MRRTPIVLPLVLGSTLVLAQEPATEPPSSPPPVAEEPAPAPAAASPDTPPAETGPSLPAAPGEPGVGDIAELSLDELLNQEITIASKAKERIFEAPSSVTVFRREELSRMGLTTLEELLNFVPGFQTTRDIEQGQSYRISARGRSSAASESVLVLVDGHRLNDLYFGGAPIPNPLITLDNVRQVEIIRGPGSALYGSNAFLGVVNIITETERSGAELRLGTPHQYAANASAATSVGDLKLSAFVGASSDEGVRYGGLNDQFGIVANTRDPRAGFDGYGVVEYRGFRLNLRHAERTFQDFVPVGALHNQFNNDLRRQSSAAATYTRQLGERVDATVGVSYDRRYWKAIQSFLPAGAELAPGVLLPENFYAGPVLETQSGRMSLDVGVELPGAHRLTSGVVYERSAMTTIQSWSSHNPFTLEFTGQPQVYEGPQAFNVKTPRTTLGAYLQDRWTPWRPLHVVAGFRFDRYSDFGSSLNPRASVVYETPFASFVRASYGKAFRAPSYLEFYDRNNPIDFGNSNLQAEDVRTFELAYTQTSEWVTGSIVAFHNRLSNLITLGAPVVDAENPLGAPQWRNSAADITVRGLELELLVRPVSPFTLRGTLTRFLTRETLATPSTFASLVANFHYRRLNVNLNGWWRHAFDALPGQDDYLVLNAATQLDLTERLQLTAAVNNLTDTRYRTLTTNPLPGGVPNRGVTFWGGLSYEL